MRPRDEANLFNPAFCGLLIHEAISGYTSHTGAGMPFALTFCVLPMTLHKSTREALPRRLTFGNGLSAWLEANPTAKIGFDKRLSVLQGVTRESLLYLFQGEMLSLNDGHLLKPTNKKTGNVKELLSDSLEIAECISSSKFVGRWLANSGSPQNTYALLGVRP